MALTLYGTVRSRAFRVLWLLEELGLDYTHVDSPPRDPAVQALSPSGKIPVLVDGDVVITDSTAILYYLADKHGQFVPRPGTLDRAKHDAHLFFVLDELDGVLWANSKHAFVLPPRLRVPEARETARAEWAVSMERLEGRLTGEYLAGDTLTIADIIAIHCLGWSVMAKFPTLPDGLKAYSKRARGRAAYKRAQSKSPA